MQLWELRLELDKPSPQGFYSEVGGLQVEVQENSTQVVVHNVDAADTDKAFNKALNAANIFLNTLSWKHNTDLKIDAEASSVTLIESSGKKHVIIRPPTASIVLEAKEPVIVIKDVSGNFISVSDSQEPGRIYVKPSDAAAYYRQAKLTNNSFDRFRNLYLVAENIADRIRTNKKLSKQKLQKTYITDSREKAPLQFALDQCFENSLEPLEQAAANTLTINEKRLLIPQVVDVLYDENRCALNHSKDSEAKKVPFKPEDEEEVGKAIPLMDFIAKSLLAYEETTLK